MKKPAKSSAKPKVISKKEPSKQAENVLLDYVKLRKEMLIDHGVDYQECEADSRNNYTGRFNG